MNRARETVRTCRVCGCTDARACEGGCWWLDERDDLCSSCAAAQSHVVRRTRYFSLVIATCNCGQFQVKLPIAHHRKMETAVRNHWREVVALARGSHG